MMNRIIECFRIARLAARKYVSSVTDEEDAELEGWMGASGSGKLERMERRLAEDLRKGRELDMEEEWRLLQKKLPRRNLFRRWRVAVAVTVGIGMAAGYLFLREEQPQQVAQSVAHKVKEYKAKLILADGHELEITDEGKRTIDVAEGIRATASEKRMRYEAADSLSASAPVQYNTLIVPRGGEFELELADGTQVWVNSGSKLVYPVQFTGACREVEMEGEVCFKVAKDEHAPFIVKTPQGVAIEVLGTFFNVEADAETGVVATTLVEGKVNVSAGKLHYTMKPDQQVVLDNGKLSVHEVDASEVVRWIDGMCYFFDTSLEDIMEKLALWYDVDVFFANPSVKEARFSLEVKRYDDVAMVLSKVEKTGRVKFDIRGKTIIVKE